MISHETGGMLGLYKVCYASEEAFLNWIHFPWYSPYNGPYEKFQNLRSWSANTRTSNTVNIEFFEKGFEIPGSLDFGSWIFFFLFFLEDGFVSIKWDWLGIDYYFYLLFFNSLKTREENIPSYFELIFWTQFRDFP